ncbi:MAG TPA: hypothetical protein VIH72_12200 [Candidatus Acidoferrales bacterium]
MKFKFVSALAAAAIVVGGLAIAFGTNADSQTKPGAGQAKATAQGGSADRGALTVPQLGDALTPYGKNTTTNNGQTSYSITVPSGKWKINVILSISPNGQVIWMTNSLTPVPDAGKVSSAALLNVLKKNRDIGPMFFEIWNGSLVMTYPVPNHDLNAAGMKSIVDDFVATVVNNASLWDPATLAAK